MGSTESCDVHEVRNISGDALSEWIFDPVDTLIITVGVPIVLGLGVFTNLSLLIVFLRIPRLRSETDVYLAHLALSDVLFLILVSAYDIARFKFSQVTKHQPFGSSAECIIYNFALNTTLVASVALVTMVSLERYLALCHPIQHLKMRSRGRTYKMVAICWGIGAGFSSFITPTYSQHWVICLRWPEEDMYTGFPSKIERCRYIPGAEWMWYISEPLFNIPWCIAMVGNIYMYVRIIYTLNKRKGVTVNEDGTSRKANAKARQIRNQVAKMLVINGVVFFLCQAPFALLILTGWICSFFDGVDNPISVVLGKHADWIVQSPLRINTVVNPLIYCAFSAQYRAAFAEAFGCNIRLGRHSANSLPVSTPTSGPRSNNQSTAQSVCSIDTSETRL